MMIRIYKMLLNGKETIDSYTVWFKPTKKAVRNGAHINAFCCNVIGSEVWGYWDDYDSNTRIGLDVKLGKRQKINDVPEPIREWAESKMKIWKHACDSNNWHEWNSI